MSEIADELERMAKEFDKNAAHIKAGIDEAAGQPMPASHGAYASWSTAADMLRARAKQLRRLAKRRG